MHEAGQDLGVIYIMVGLFGELLGNGSGNLELNNNTMMCLCTSEPALPQIVQQDLSEWYGSFITFQLGSFIGSRVSLNIFAKFAGLSRNWTPANAILRNPLCAWVVHAVNRGAGV